MEEALLGRTYISFCRTWICICCSAGQPGLEGVLLEVQGQRARHSTAPKRDRLLFKHAAPGFTSLQRCQPAAVFVKSSFFSAYPDGAPDDGVCGQIS